MKLRSLITLLFLFFIAESHAIWLTIPSSGTKCVSEDIQSNVVVLADYYVVADEVDHNQIHTVSLKVTSPYGNNLHQKENVTHGQFAFTSAESGTYLACFWLQNINNHQQPTVTVSLDWRTGISAKDWETVAKKEKIQVIPTFLYSFQYQMFSVPF
ncbi:Transmembrane emp24 domain-containing protein [Arachis hypogaea]|nr:Transmembrane emp24 domain-containing protein [Arachis hypogaea]